MARIPLNIRFRTIPGRGLAGGAGGWGVTGAAPTAVCACAGRRGEESRPIEIGPVTLFMIRLEKATFSTRDPAPNRILITQPYVS